MAVSTFKQRVIHIVQLIPFGYVMSYGQVAAYVGIPRAARQVGWTLNGLEETISLPWWRVINNAGKITIKGNRFNTPDIQRKLLRSEDIIINEDFTLDINKYRYVFGPEELKKLDLDDDYITILLGKIPFSSNK